MIYVYRLRLSLRLFAPQNLDDAIAITCDSAFTFFSQFTFSQVSVYML